MPGRTLLDILASVNDCVYYQKEYHYIYICLGLGIATVSGILSLLITEGGGHAPARPWGHHPYCY